MKTENKNIIEMRPSEGDDGELRYTQAHLIHEKGTLSGRLFKILGVALGAAIFLLLIFFFVYVIVPLVLILILYSLIKNIFKPRR